MFRKCSLVNLLSDELNYNGQLKIIFDQNLLYTPPYFVQNRSFLNSKERQPFSHETESGQTNFSCSFVEVETAENASGKRKVDIMIRGKFATFFSWPGYGNNLSTLLCLTLKWCHNNPETGWQSFVVYAASWVHQLMVFAQLLYTLTASPVCRSDSDTGGAFFRLFLKASTTASNITAIMTTGTETAIARIVTKLSGNLELSSRDTSSPARMT